MDLSKARSEPFVRLVEFHDAFNRSMKLCSASVAFVERMAGLPEAGKPLSEIILRADSEPWGHSPWKSIEEAAPQAKSFVAELGIVRAMSAFEDYVTRAWSELDRAEGSTPATETAAKPDTGSEEAEASDPVPPYSNILARLQLAPDPNVLRVVEFMVMARNCIVHRSNRASAALQKSRESDELRAALGSWSRRSGKWKVSFPAVVKGSPVPWLPRHSIAASDCFYRLARQIDSKVVARLGDCGMVLMATHWCLLEKDPVPSPAKLNAQTVIRTQLHGRYGAKSIDANEVIGLLRGSGKWKNALAAFEKLRDESAL
ncbi:MAG TPA: hypothetical protein VNT30_21235 [Stellaceae bacterium]|nr:hypothetical protein [Stellaceae bacterium]